MKQFLLYIYAKDDQGYRNLLKMSSAVSVRRVEMLPLQWLEAYSAGCIIVCPMTDESWDGYRKEESLHQLIKHSGNQQLSSLARSARWC